VPDPLTVFLATAIGMGASGESAPGLVSPSPALTGHLEVGVEWRHAVSIALATALGRSWYDNTVPPPEGVTPGDSLVVSRAGLGLVGEGRMTLLEPLDTVSFTAGAGAYLDRVSGRAKGSVLGVGGNYYEESDVGAAIEGRVGADLRLGRPVLLGLRAGWIWYGADLPDVTDGDASLGGPFVELRLTLDVTDLRMDQPE
jgi:hypothetical protein